VFETMVAVLFLISEDSQIGGEIGHFVDDRHYSQSHFGLGLACSLSSSRVMLLAVIYLC